MPTADSANAMDQISFLAAAVDTSKSNIARVYDYWLGGKDNFAADREVAERVLSVFPRMGQLVRENRLFLARAVTWLAEEGIRQFIDIGSGLPTAQNTHQVAQAVDRACRVVYVDYDHVVVAHGNALLSGDTTAAIWGDARDPASILTDPAVQRLIQMDKPVAVILALVLHFFDAAAAEAIITAFVSALPPGSYLVLSVGAGDEETGGRITREYTASTYYNHTPEQIAGFFADLELVGPGLTDARDWQPNLVTVSPPHRGGRVLAGVGQKLATEKM